MTAIQLTAPLHGWAAALDDVPDAVFAGRMLGDGAAIDPLGTTLLAPCDGQVLTLHAGGLSPAQSRAAWEAKKAELLRGATANLGRDLHDAPRWAEEEILARGQSLADAACRLWPYPAAADEA